MFLEGRTFTSEVRCMLHKVRCEECTLHSPRKALPQGQRVIQQCQPRRARFRRGMARSELNVNRMKTLETLFLDELMDMYDAEQRIVRALPKMIKAATCAKLQGALQSHWRETQGQVTKLERVFKSIGERARGKKCEATIGLLKEGDEIAGEFKGSPAINAALIAAAQKVEHYEMASYGCLHEWAGLLGHDTAAKLLAKSVAGDANVEDQLEVKTNP